MKPIRARNVENVYFYVWKIKYLQYILLKRMKKKKNIEHFRPCEVSIIINTRVRYGYKSQEGANAHPVPPPNGAHRLLIHLYYRTHKPK